MRERRVSKDRLPIERAQGNGVGDTHVSRGRKLASEVRAFLVLGGLPVGANPSFRV